MMAILIALIWPAVLGRYARRVERGEGPAEEKMQRIQRATIAGLVLFLAMRACGSPTCGHRRRLGNAMASGVLPRWRHPGMDQRLRRLSAGSGAAAS